MRASLSLSASIINSSLTNPKPDKISQNNLKKIQQHVSTFYTTPQCAGFCTCHICQQKFQMIDRGKQFLRQTSSLLKIDTSRIKTFFKLISAVSNKVAFRLDIPTLCFFQKGECKLMFKSKNEFITMQQNSQVFKKNIANFFVQANRKKADLKSIINVKKDNHIKHFSTVVPSYVHGTNQDNTKMKEAKIFHFHTDKRFENDQHFLVQKKADQQVAIVKFLDDKGYELVNEKQLRQLLKSPTNTLSIDFIQSYIKPDQVESQFQFSSYNGFTPIQNNLMFTRSQTHIKLQINLITPYSKDYIPIQHLQSYQQVLKQIPQEYILYQNYKIVHFIEIVRNLKVKNLTTVWIKDQSKEICFFGILDFQYDQINGNNDIGFVQSYGIKEIIEKPFSELQGQLMGMWERMKQKKLKQLEDKREERAKSQMQDD